MQVIPEGHVFLSQEGLSGSPSIADTFFVQNLLHPACTGLEGSLKVHARMVSRYEKRILPARQHRLGV